MFSHFKFGREEPITEAEQKLQQVIQLLFPPLELQEDESGTKYHIDRSADSNLEAALADLEEGYNDRNAQNTIRRISDRLFQVRKILEAENEIDIEAKYYVVDVSKDEMAEDITAGDDFGQ